MIEGILDPTTIDLADLKRKYSATLIQLDLLRPTLMRIDTRERLENEHWSINEILGHIIDADRSIWWPRIVAALSNTDAYFNDIDQDELVREHGWQDLSVQEILGQLMRVRWNCALELNKLSEADFHRTGTHCTHGELSVQGILQLLIAHDAHYIGKIRALAGVSHEYAGD